MHVLNYVGSAPRRRSLRCYGPQTPMRRATPEAGFWPKLPVVRYCIYRRGSPAGPLAAAVDKCISARRGDVEPGATCRRCSEEMGPRGGMSESTELHAIVTHSCY